MTRFGLRRVWLVALVAFICLVRVPLRATWDKGFNFRASSGYATDGTNETYVLDTDSYTGSVIRNGVAFGWTVAPSSSRDRNNALDRRVAGINFGTSGTFRIDLPATGNYDVWLAMGDAGASQTQMQIKIKDNGSTLLTIGPHDTPLGADFYDATDTYRASAAAWVSNGSVDAGSGAAAHLTFSSTIFQLTLEAPVGVTNSCIAHLFISQTGGGGGGATPSSGGLMTLGVGMSILLTLGTVGILLYGSVRLAQGAQDVYLWWQDRSYHAANYREQQTVARLRAQNEERERLCIEKPLGHPSKKVERI